MIRGVIRALAIGPALFFAAGCCCFVPAEPETTVVVVPSRHDGHVGAVVVSHGEERQVLNTAYAAVTMGVSGPLKQKNLSETEVAEVRKTFEAASEALPAKAVTYVLYFELSTDNLTAESNAKLDTILSDVSGRSAAEIVVVGHSDSLGSDEANLALSQRRADRMRDLIVARGVSQNLIRAVGVGKNDPEVRTGDNVEEARNRRVEITVR